MAVAVEVAGNTLCHVAKEQSVMLKKAVTLMFAFALVASVASAQERKDLQVFRDISNSVNRYTQFTIFDNIEASVTDGNVVLSGWVTMPYKKDDIELLPSPTPTPLFDEGTGFLRAQPVRINQK